jgi:hypothetical protein
MPPVYAANRGASVSAAAAGNDPPRGYMWVLIAIHGEKAAVRAVTEYVRHDS